MSAADRPQPSPTATHREDLQSKPKSLQRASQRHSSTLKPSSSACGRPFPRAPRAPLRSAGAMRAFRLSPSLRPPPRAAAKSPNCQTPGRPADIGRRLVTDPGPTAINSRPLTVQSVLPVTWPSPKARPTRSSQEQGLIQVLTRPTTKSKTRFYAFKRQVKQVKQVKKTSLTKSKTSF